jgi:hypothetical protein
MHLIELAQVGATLRVRGLVRVRACVAVTAVAFAEELKMKTYFIFNKNINCFVLKIIFISLLARNLFFLHIILLV